MKRRQFIKAGLGAGATASMPLCLSRPLAAAELPADITELSGVELSMAIRDRHVSCFEVMEAYLDRIHRYNPVYNAIINMADDDTLLVHAMDADRALDRGEYRGWMHGMPHAVKELQPVAGMRFTSGSPLYADRIAEQDSAMVARLRKEGAIFIGKTNVPEFGLGSQSYNPLYGATGSAWNPALTSGGSSGGAASGLGTHMLPVADGSDMMGSLRNPGAFNNVIGFRPSTNVMGGGPAEPRGLSTSGPMGRNTADAIRLLQTIAVANPGNRFAPLSLRNLRIGWMGDLDGYLAMEPGIIELCANNLVALEREGMNVDSLLPDFSLTDLWFCWTTLRHSGRAGMQDEYVNPELRPLLKPELAWEIEQSLILTDNDRARANAIRLAWYRELDRLFDRYDFLALPTSQVFPYSKEIHWPQQIAGRQMDTYHRWMEVVIPGSLGGLPVLNVPVGFDSRGRPMGMQIMGNFGEDRKVLEFGLAYEQITTYLRQRPTLVAA